MARVKVVTVVGTRPEIIRLSRVIVALESASEHLLVHTGQNVHYELSGVFFDELGLRAPDHYLGIDTSSLGRILGDTLVRSEAVFNREQPDAVLILGDTNSAFSALIAKRMGIPVYHMEAGNRCFDENVPEEINRRIIDHLADFNLVYTEHARRNLLGEGLHPRRIYLTGSPLFEVLTHYRDGIDASDVLDRLGLEAGQYMLVSMHRQENVDSRHNLACLLDALEGLWQRLQQPVIVSTHPRTRARLEGSREVGDGYNIRFLEPFGFMDYNKLQLHARCVLSDSGSVSEESSILGFPAVSIRNATERPEALDSGTVILSGVNPEAIERCVELADSQRRTGAPSESPPEYRVANCSQRVVNLIVGTAPLSPQWSNLDRGRL